MKKILLALLLFPVLVIAQTTNIPGTLTVGGITLTSATSTLSGATIDGGANTLTNIPVSAVGATGAQGSVFYSDGTHLVALSPGTSGQFLQTQGASANPQWAAPGGEATVTLAAGVADLGSTPANLIHINSRLTGGSVTSLGTSPVGTIKVLTVDNNEFIFINSSAIAIPGAQNYTPSSYHDYSIFISLGSGNWQLLLDVPVFQTVGTALLSTNGNQELNAFFNAFGGGSFYQIDNGMYGLTYLEGAGGPFFFPDGSVYLANANVSIDGSGNLSAASIGTNTVTLYPTVFASLPASPETGTEAVITDALAAVYNSTVTVGGGTITIHVYFDGTNWREN